MKRTTKRGRRKGAAEKLDRGNLDSISRFRAAKYGRFQKVGTLVEHAGQFASMEREITKSLLDAFDSGRLDFSAWIPLLGTRAEHPERERFDRMNLRVLLQLWMRTCDGLLRRIAKRDAAFFRELADFLREQPEPAPSFSPVDPTRAAVLRHKQRIAAKRASAARAKEVFKIPGSLRAVQRALAEEGLTPPRRGDAAKGRSRPRQFS